MTIALAYSTSANPASFTGNNLTLSVTVPAGLVDSVLVITKAVEKSSFSDLTGITVNGSATGVTEQITNAVAANRSNRIWTLVAPPAGTYNIVLSFTTSSTNGGLFSAMVFTGVDQASPVSATAQSSQGSVATPISVAIATLAGGVAVSAANVLSGTTLVAGNSATTLFAAGSAGVSYKTDSTASSWGWSGTSPTQASQAVAALRPAPVPDTTPPNLTSPLGAATGTITASVGATTDEGNGTLYAVVTTSATPPSVAQLQAGQDHTGAAAAWAGSQAVSSTGAKTLNATGLAASTAYRAHLHQEDAAGNESAVVTSASFTTSAPDTTAPTLSSPTGAPTGSTSASGDVVTNEANGTLYYLASANASESAATVKASGATQAVSALGSQPVAVAGLVASTTYYLHYVHRDAAGNDSAVASSSSFSTPASGSGGTLNFQAAGMEFGRRSGLGIGTFGLDAGASYRYTVHANTLTLGAALYTSTAIALDGTGKLPSLSDAAFVAGTTYRVHAIRQADGEACTFRVTAS